MAKTLITLLGACLAAMSLTATASAATVNGYLDTCEGDVEWRVTLNALNPSYADLSYTNFNCDYRTLFVRPNDATASTAPGTSNGGTYQKSLTLTNAIAGPAFVGTATGSGGTGTVTATTGTLAATLETVQPNVSGGDAVVVTEVFVSEGTCGSGCYRTHVTKTGELVETSP